jgi:predicted N-acyltransferase
MRRCCWAPPALDVRMSDSVEGLGGDAWDGLASQAGPFLQRPYLRAMAAGAGPGEHFRFASFHEDGLMVGVACFQLTRFKGRSLGEQFRERGWVPFLLRWLGLGEGSLSFQVLVCGNPATSGEHGFHFAPTVPPERAMGALLQALAAAKADLERITPIDGLLVKDLPAQASAFGTALARQGFAKLKLEPAMVLPVDPSWDSFETYLACLTSKYRVKANRAYAKSQALTVQDLDAEALLAHRERVMQLYHSVYEKSAYRLGSLTFPMLLNLRRTLGPDFILRGYFHQGLLVGFFTAFVRGGILEAHQVGLDYGLNPGLSIYPRILCDFLRLALERRCSQVNYGRTAMEIKSTLGAEPVETCCYLRHRDRIPNQLVHWVASRLRPPHAPLRMPFTREWYELKLRDHPATLG